MTRTDPTVSHAMDGEVQPTLPEVSPDLFQPDQAQASRDFEQALRRSAWFGNDNTAEKGPCLGVRVTDDRVYEIDGPYGRAVTTLRRGGMLLQMKDGQIFAAQPELLEVNYFRCFDDGTLICHLWQPAQEQTLALLSANSQMRNRIQEMVQTSFFHGLIYFWALRKERRSIMAWNQQIQAHVKDLFLVSHLKVLASPENPPHEEPFHAPRQ